MTDVWVEKFRKIAIPKLEKEFKPEKIILFGSRAKGTAKENSDLDVIVISTSFDKMPFLRRMPLVLRKVSFPKHVDYICYTPSEFKKMKKESAIIKDAMESAKEIAA